MFSFYVTTPHVFFLHLQISLMLFFLIEYAFFICNNNVCY